MIPKERKRVDIYLLKKVETTRLSRLWLAAELSFKFKRRINRNMICGMLWRIKKRGIIDY